MEAGLCFAILGWPEIIGVLIILMVLFGARWLPLHMREMGHGLREFKRATQELGEELNRPPKESGLV